MKGKNNMKIKNLSQLKKALTKGRKVLMIRHAMADSVGLVREVNVVHTNGVYMTAYNQPEHRLSTCNGGKGSWCGYSQAKFYRLGDTVTLYSTPGDESSLIYEFEVLDDE